MNRERKKMKFEILLERYFTNFHRILLLNLIFAVPSAFAFGIVYLINHILLSTPVIFVYFLSIILLCPFYSGVVTVVRNIARGDEDVKVLSTYLNALKENFFSFLLHGVVICAAAILSYLSLSMYIGMLKLSWFFYVLLFICIVIVVFVTFTVYYIPLMSVTFDIKKRYIYKNSFLMSFGEFKNNFFATFALAIVLALFFTVTVFCTSVTALVLVCVGFWVLLLPATCTFVVIFFIYDGMYNLIVNKESKKKNIEEKIQNGGKAPAKTEPEFDYSEIDLSSLKDPDAYIYFNGRMVKQSVVIEKLRAKEAENHADEPSD